VSVETMGLEPTTPSLRNMRSNGAGLGKQLRFVRLWSGCGASEVMQREML